MAVKSTRVRTGEEPTAVPEEKIAVRTDRVWQAAHGFRRKGVLVSNVITVLTPAVTTACCVGSV